MSRLEELSGVSEGGYLLDLSAVNTAVLQCGHCLTS